MTEKKFAWLKVSNIDCNDKQRQTSTSPKRWLIVELRVLRWLNWTLNELFAGGSSILAVLGTLANILCFYNGKIRYAWGMLEHSSTQKVCMLCTELSIVNKKVSLHWSTNELWGNLFVVVSSKKPNVCCSVIIKANVFCSVILKANVCCLLERCPHSSI